MERGQQGHAERLDLAEQERADDGAGEAASPPMTMAMNASSTMPAPIWGERLVMAPRITPAAAASPEPSANTTVLSRWVLTPSTAAIVGSWVAARIDRPSEVRSTTSHTPTASTAAATRAKTQ